MIITKELGELFVPNGLESPKEMTKRYLDLLNASGCRIPVNNTKHKRLQLPNNLLHIKDKEERKEYARELLKRWKHGHDGLCGMGYAYYHYMKILNRSTGGAIVTEFRNYDMAEFELLESCLYGKSRLWGGNKSKGIIGLGARGKGKSSKAGAAAISTIQCNKETTVLLTSKDEAAAEKQLMQEKIKFTYYRLPEYLRFSEISNNRGMFHIGKTVKNKFGFTEVLGNDSKIIVKAPTPEANEGFGAKLWVHDEAGKTKNLIELVDYTLPALCGTDGFTRDGVPYLLGVAGDFDKFGRDYIELWEKADSRDLIRWFIPGWIGMCLDPYGNEDIEQAVEMLLKKRFMHFHNGERDGAMHLQQYPLTPEEALRGATSGILPQKKIIFQAKTIANAEEKPYKQGSYKWTVKGKVANFYPDRAGKIKILEFPEGNDFNQTKYIGFIDAYDIKKIKETGSKGAAHVFKRRSNIPLFKIQELTERLAHKDTTFEDALKIRLELGYMPVAQYIDAPEDPRDFAEVAAMMFTHYSCPALVEKFPSMIFTYFEDNYKHLSQYTPVKPKAKYTAEDLYGSRGIKIDEYWKDIRTSYLVNYYEEHYQSIYFEELLKEAMDYDPTIDEKKYDAVDSLGGCLIHDGQPILKKEEKNSKISGKLWFGFTNNGEGGIRTV
jgi:hypothetical protein